MPDELAPLAIPAEAVITSVNGAPIESAAGLLGVVKKVARKARPTRVFVEYVLKGKPHAIEYRIM